MKTFRVMTRIAAVTATLLPLWTPKLRAASGAQDAATRAHIDNSYAKLPLQFEANQGQQPVEVKFLSRGKDYTVFLTPDGATLSLRKVRRQIRLDKPGPPVTEPELEAAADLRLRLEGGNPTVKMTGGDPLPGAVNYFIGKTAPSGAPTSPRIRRYGTSRFTRASTWFFTATSGSLNTISCSRREPLRTPSGCPSKGPNALLSIRLRAIWCCRRQARRSDFTSRWSTSPRLRTLRARK